MHEQDKNSQVATEDAHKTTTFMNECGKTNRIQEEYKDVHTVVHAVSSRILTVEKK